MLKATVLICALTCGACTSALPAFAGDARRVRIYDAPIFQSEYGAAIMDANCPTGGLMIKIDSSLHTTEFIKVLRHGGGDLGSADKYVVVDGIVETTGVLGDRSEVTLVRVISFREKIFNPQQYVELSEKNLGCEKDPNHQRAWLKSLQRKRR